MIEYPTVCVYAYLPAHGQSWHEAVAYHKIYIKELTVPSAIRSFVMDLYSILGIIEEAKESDSLP